VLISAIVKDLIEEVLVLKLAQESLNQLEDALIQLLDSQPVHLFIVHHVRLARLACSLAHLECTLVCRKDLRDTGLRVGIYLVHRYSLVTITAEDLLLLQADWDDA